MRCDPIGAISIHRWPAAIGSSPSNDHEREKEMIHRGPGPDITIPDVDICTFVLAHAERLADKPAIVDGPSGRALTYGQLAGAVRRTAAGLAARGFGKGDVLGIYCPNLPEYGVVFLGAASLGGICTTVNPLYTAGELATQLADAGASLLVTVPPVLDKAREAAARAGIRELFVLGEGEGATPFAALLAGSGPPPTVAIDPAEDLVALPYSSGTTGLPKGVMLTHRNLVANLRQMETMPSYRHFRESDTLVAVLPFFHIYGMVVILFRGLASGATIVTMPRFEMEAFLRILQDYKVTIAPLVPPIVLGLAKHPAVDGFDLSSLERVVCGAAPLGADVAREAERRVGCTVAQGYGMTEASPVTHLPPSADPAKVRIGSIGWIVPNTEVRIVDVLTREPLGPEQEGELLIRGPQIMKGYLNRPVETAASLDAEGWYASGDIGKVDREGYFYIVDRVKELIKYKGMAVAPAELEALLLTHPAVRDAAVIPSPDAEAGEVPKAFVVRQGETTAEALMAFVAEQVAPHKRVRRLEFVEEIPKSASGKILRRVLIERERAR
jgi:acyl-CoA synthetase (AMP-forming)/AMP-acid ligase II